MMKSRFSFKRYVHAFLFCSKPERLVVEEIGNGVQIFAKKEIKQKRKRIAKIRPVNKNDEAQVLFSLPSFSKRLF